MKALEVCLLIIGVGAYAASFMLPEKKEKNEPEKIGEEEIKKIIEQQIPDAREQIKVEAKEQADAPLDLRAPRAQDEEELGSTTPGLPSHDAKNLPDPSLGLVPRFSPSHPVTSTLMMTSVYPEPQRGQLRQSPTVGDDALQTTGSPSPPGMQQ